MYCPNCGNELNGDKSCSKCDYVKEVKEEENNVVDNVTSAPKKLNKSALIVTLVFVFIIIIFIIGLFSLIFFSTFKFIDNITTREYIGINNIEVASVYKVLGYEKKVCRYDGSVGNASNNTFIDYCNSLSDEEEQLYVEYLMEKEDFEFVQGSYKYTLVKEIGDNVYVIAIDGNDCITYSCFSDAGKIDNNVEIEM